MLPPLSGLSFQGLGTMWRSTEFLGTKPVRMSLFQASFFVDCSQAACTRGPSEEKHTRSQLE